MTAQEAAKFLLESIQDPSASVSLMDWQDVWNAMRADHEQSMEICGMPDWPSVLVAALEAISGEAP